MNDQSEPSGRKFRLLALGLSLSEMLVAAGFVLPTLWSTQAIGVSFEPTDEALYLEMVSSILAPRMVLAAALVVIIAVLAFTAGRKHPVPALATVTVIAVVVVVMSLNTRERLESMLRPYEPQLATLNTFVPPPNWEKVLTDVTVTNVPEAKRIWATPSTLPEGCAVAESISREWAEIDPSPPQSFDTTQTCTFFAIKGRNRVEVEVSLLRDEPTTVSITVTSIVKVDPASL